MESSGILQQVRDVVDREAGVSDEVNLTETLDLWVAGMDSLASVNVMVQLEETFGVEFPDEMLTHQVFTSIASIAAAIGSLLGATVD